MTIINIIEHKLCAVKCSTSIQIQNIQRPQHHFPTPAIQGNQVPKHYWVRQNLRGFTSKYWVQVQHAATRILPNNTPQIRTKSCYILYYNSIKGFRKTEIHLAMGKLNRRQEPRLGMQYYKQSKNIQKPTQTSIMLSIHHGNTITKCLNYRTGFMYRVPEVGISTAPMGMTSWAAHNQTGFSKCQ